MMKRIGCALVGVLVTASALAADPTNAPSLLTDEQMGRVVAGGVVDTQGRNLELIAPGNSINSCNSGKCYWFNAKSGKEIGKPAPGS